MRFFDRRQLLKGGLSIGACSLFPDIPLALAFPWSPDPSSPPFDPKGFEEPLIHAPQEPARWPEFRQTLADWRHKTRWQLRYDESLYRQAAFQWVSTSFSCCFLMMNDLAFYDPAQNIYLVDSWLERGRQEFGGYDSVVLWHAYPRIGLDNRNQFDFYRDMPGGWGGLRRVSERFQRQGVRVYVDYNPWDTGTRREDLPDLDALARLVGELHVDGIFLDTMTRGAEDFRGKLDAVRPGVVLESEGALPLENLHNHHMSWAQWFKDQEVPGILRNKWIERHHMQHQIQRWNRDHSMEIQSAWMNGSGIMVWENVFGSWVGWNARDRSWLRLMLPVQRRFSTLFSSEEWTPLVDTLKPGIFASSWKGGRLQLWVLVNRRDEPVQGELLQVPGFAGASCYDLMQGKKISPSDTGSTWVLAGLIPPRGLGSFLMVSEQALGKDFAEFLAGQQKLWQRVSNSTDFPAMTTMLRPLISTRKYTKNDVPPAMVIVPETDFKYRVNFRIRECGFYESQPEDPVKWPLLHKPISFERTVHLATYAIDLTPVTNAQFAEFLRETNYRPTHPENFLKHWRNGRPPASKLDHPVVYVDLMDARSYAHWAGKRLLTEEEWQYAAQGPQMLHYPWGSEMQPSRCNGGETGDTTPVTAFPDGRSPFGCYDMCGNTWEWTESERRDDHTRFCMLRGGSYYQAKGSEWYMDGGPQPADFAAKFLLMCPGLDRCATIGFRCAADLESQA